MLATAVLGPDAERAAVLTLSDTSEAAIVEAIDAGVLVEDGATLAFSHPIYAHTAYDRAASSATRRDLHARRRHHRARGSCDRAPPRRRGRAHRRRRAQVRAVGGQRRAGPGRVGRGGPLLRGRARPAAGAGGAGRAAPPGRAEPARQPAAGPGRHPLRGRARPARARRRRRHPRRAPPLAHPLRHRHPARCSTVVADREPLEALVDERRGRRPRAGGRGTGGAVAVVLGRVAHEAGGAVRAPGDGDRRGARRPLGLRARHHRAQRAAVGALRPARFAGDVGGRRRPRAAPRPTSRCSRVGRCSGCRSCSRGSAGSTRPRRARSSAATIAERTQYPLELGLPLAALTQIAVARGDFDRGRAVRAPGAPAATPLGLPLGRRAVPARRSRAAHAARGQFEQAPRSAGHVVGDRRRDRAGQRRPLLPLGRPRASAVWRCSARRSPACPANRWWAATRGRCWRSSSRSGKARPATCARRHDLLAEIERRGGVLIGGTASLVARHLGVAQDLLGDEAGAIATLHRAIALARDAARGPRAGPRAGRPRHHPPPAGRARRRVRAARRGGRHLPPPRPRVRRGPLASS